MSWSLGRRRQLWESEGEREGDWRRAAMAVRELCVAWVELLWWCAAGQGELEREERVRWSSRTGG